MFQSLACFGKFEAVAQTSGGDHLLTLTLALTLAPTLTLILTLTQSKGCEP